MTRIRRDPTGFVFGGEAGGKAYVQRTDLDFGPGARDEEPGSRLRDIAILDNGDLALLVVGAAGDVSLRKIVSGTPVDGGGVSDSNLEPLAVTGLPDDHSLVVGDRSGQPGLELRSTETGVPDGTIDAPSVKWNQRFIEAGYLSDVLVLPSGAVIVSGWGAFGTTARPFLLRYVQVD